MLAMLRPPGKLGEGTAVNSGQCMRRCDMAGSASRSWLLVPVALARVRSEGFHGSPMSL